MPTDILFLFFLLGIIIGLLIKMVWPPKIKFEMQKEIKYESVLFTRGFYDSHQAFDMDLDVYTIPKSAWYHVKLNDPKTDGYGFYSKGTRILKPRLVEIERYEK